MPQNVTKDWWYFSFETGQHVAFYTVEALQRLAEKFGKQFYTDGKGMHLFTKERLSNHPFEMMAAQKPEDSWLVHKMRTYVNRHDDGFENRLSHTKKESLLDKDWREAKKRITK